MPHVSVSPGAEGGFVRFPRSFVTLPVSPGAKCVLIHLCSAANDDGESWYSYDDIATLVGRSKASVTAYVHELVELGLIRAIRQTMANGYNYRRKLKIVGWRDLVSHWADRTQSLAKAREEQARVQADSISNTDADTSHAPAQTSPAPSSLPSGDSQAEDHSRAETRGALPARLDTPLPSSFSSSQNTECSVQPAECSDPTGPKTNNHQTKTHSPGTAEPKSTSGTSWSRDDEAQWRRIRPSDRDPIAILHGQIAEKLGTKINATAQELARRLGIIDQAEAKRSALPWLKDFATRHRLRTTAEEIEAAADALAAIAETNAGLEAITNALEASWKPHWRRLSTPTQIKALAPVARRAPGAPTARDREELALFRNRSWVVRFHALSSARRARKPEPAL